MLIVIHIKHVKTIVFNGSLVGVCVLREDVQGTVWSGTIRKILLLIRITPSIDQSSCKILRGWHILSDHSKYYLVSNDLDKVLMVQSLSIRITSKIIKNTISHISPYKILRSWHALLLSNGLNKIIMVKSLSYGQTVKLGIVYSTHPCIHQSPCKILRCW